MAYPADLMYMKSHEWLSVEGTGGTVGITDYAQQSLGDIVFVELPKVGAAVKAGEIFGSVESVKAVSDLYAPASGTITAVNEALGSAPETINADANATWIYKFDLAGEPDGDLLDAAAYEKFVSEETGH